MLVIFLRQTLFHVVSIGVVCFSWGLANESYLSGLSASVLTVVFLLLNKWGETRPTLLVVKGFGMSLILFVLFAMALQPYDYNTHPEEQFVSSVWLILYLFSALTIYIHELFELFKASDTDPPTGEC